MISKLAIFHVRSRSSFVGIAMGYGFDSRGSIPCKDKDFSVLSIRIGSVAPRSV
jgi:hypothetical protein